MSQVLGYDPPDEEERPEVSVCLACVSLLVGDPPRSQEVAILREIASGRTHKVTIGANTVGRGKSCAIQYVLFGDGRSTSPCRTSRLLYTRF